MAETRARSEGRPRSTRRTSRARGAASRSRARANGRPADAGAQRSRAAARATRQSAGAANGTAEGAGTLHQIVDKAKVPALAGGAAVAAVVGGVVLARNGRARKSSIPLIGKKRGGVSLPHVSMPHVSMPHLPKPSDGDTKDALKATAKALGGAAVEVGKAGYRMGELASEVRRVREQASKDR
jgi:hypothetical protein